MPTKVIGHRGSAGYYPENSIEGFLHAIEVGADGVEIDVQKTVDDIFILFHDDDIEGTPFQKLTYLEVVEKTGRKPTLLVEALEEVRNKIFCDAEIKISVGADIGKAIQAFQDILPEDQYHIKSFEESILIFLRKGGYKSPIALNLGFENIDLSRYTPNEVVRKIQAIDPYQVHPAREFMFSWVVESLREVGLPLWVWTVDNPAEVEYFLGVDSISGIITNRLPETLRIRSTWC